MNRLQKLHARIKEQGRQDAREGKPIEAYYETEVPKWYHNGRHPEALRAVYENGYRLEVAEMRKANSP